MKLIIINGPCGVGKSSLAKRLHDDRPLSFLLDVDAQARFISHYREFREERWEMTLAITKAILHAMFKLGRTVIVDKMTYVSSVLDAYYDIAQQYDIEVHEITLWADKETVLSRANARGYHEGGLLTPERVCDFWHCIEELLKERDVSEVINTTSLSEDQVYTLVSDLVK